MATPTLSPPEPDAMVAVLPDLDSHSPNGSSGGPSPDPQLLDEPPQWSEMKTKAGKERKRLPLACIACRRKKIRCSGEKPACKHCLRTHIPCVYKATARKAAPRTDYMAMLDRRLKRMEDRVVRLIPKHSLPAVAHVGRSVVKPGLPAAPPRVPAAKKRPAQDDFDSELDAWAKPATADPATAHAKHPPDTSLLEEGADSLPAKEIQEHLAQVYFDYVYGQSYPLLHKPSFMRRLAAGKVPPVLILALCALSARFSTHPHIRSEPCFLRGDHWATRAREIALKRYDTPNITILIVYLLLGLHEFGTCQGGRSWMFGGMAQRMAYALQLHKENEYDPLVNAPDKKPLSATDREIRRRTMWSCFLMDRFNSSGTDRPLFMHEQYIEVQLPIKEHLYLQDIYAPTENLEGQVPNPFPPDRAQLANARDNMGVSAYTIRLVCIWGKLIKFMNMGGKEREAEPMWSPHSTYHAIKREAHHFKASLPDMLTYSLENLKSHAVGKTANSFLYLHIFWQQIMLFMHRFALPSTAGSRPPKDMPLDFLTESARAALDAANQISILIHEAMDHNVVAPFAGYSAFFSSTVHVHGVFSKNPKLEAQSKKYLAYNVKYLTKMKKYWGMFYYMAENLKELYRQHADAQFEKPASLGQQKKRSIFQYGDWFDRYPHGVSNTDFEDAADSKSNEPGMDAVLGQKSDLQSVEEFFASLSPPTSTDQARKQPRKNKSKSVSKLDLIPLDTDPSSKMPIPSQPRQHQQRKQSQQQLQNLQQPQLHQQQVDHADASPHGSMNIIDAAIAASYDPTTLFTTAHMPQHQLSQPTQSEQFLPQYSPHPNPHSSFPLLSPSPSSLFFHPQPNQLDLASPFPDLNTSFNMPNFWDFDPLAGLSTKNDTTTTNNNPAPTLYPNPTTTNNNNNNNNNTFFDPMSSCFVPFNVAPPLFPHATPDPNAITPNDPAAAAAAAATATTASASAFPHFQHPEPYGFSLGAGTPVNLDLLHGPPAGHDALLE